MDHALLHNNGRRGRMFWRAAWLACCGARVPTLAASALNPALISRDVSRPPLHNSLPCASRRTTSCHLASIGRRSAACPPPAAAPTRAVIFHLSRCLPLRRGWTDRYCLRPQSDALLPCHCMYVYICMLQGRQYSMTSVSRTGARRTNSGTPGL
jgi:hypothetical protein